MERLKLVINSILFNKEITETARKEYKKTLNDLLKTLDKKILKDYVKNNIEDTKLLNNPKLNKFLVKINI
jgi:hypothetical protein